MPSVQTHSFQNCVARRRDRDQGCLRKLVAHKALHNHLQQTVVDTAMDMIIEQLIQSDLEDQERLPERTESR